MKNSVSLIIALLVFGATHAQAKDICTVQETVSIVENDAPDGRTYVEGKFTPLFKLGYACRSTYSILKNGVAVGHTEMGDSERVDLKGDMTVAEIYRGAQDVWGEHYKGQIAKLFCTDKLKVSAQKQASKLMAPIIKKLEKSGVCVFL